MAESLIYYLFILITVRVPLNSRIINSFCEISNSTMWLAAARLWNRHSADKKFKESLDRLLYKYAHLLTLFIDSSWSSLNIMLYCNHKNNKQRWNCLMGLPYERNKKLSLSFASIQLQEFLVPRRFKVSEKFTFYSFIIVPVCHL